MRLYSQGRDKVPLVDGSVQRSASLVLGGGDVGGGGNLVGAVGDRDVLDLDLLGLGLAEDELLPGVVGLLDHLIPEK